MGDRHMRTAVLLLTAFSFAATATADTKPITDIPEFGILRPAPAEAARTQALDWLKSVGPVDAADQATFDATWASDRTVLDKVADTFALGSPEAARLLADVRDLDAAAPLHAPAIVSDPSQAPFFRDNFALAYARALSERRVFEQVLETLHGVRPEQTVDPATYFFVKAVAEHALMHKAEAMEALDRLTSDVAEIPMRYRTVAALMAEDMDQWTDDGVDPIAREASAVKDRLDLGRADEKTRQMQKDVVKRIDDLIKKLETPAAVDPATPTAQPLAPAEDSTAESGVSGAGAIDMKKLKETAEQWGAKSPKERAEAMREMTRNLPPDLRETVQRYFQGLSDAHDDDDGK